ncbi:hypothetical protein [Tolypothrix sp. VBCCA 56010]|uniref:hypothetical protein n=1 Tax=Tolypothrix sp. VBCCA 56010 TaxID=3137731 RepID=UPI003D7E368E
MDVYWVKSRFQAHNAVSGIDLVASLYIGYLDADNFVDFVYNRNLSIAPVLSWAISDKTKFSLEGGYQYFENGYSIGLPAVGTVLPNPNGKIPRNPCLL